MTINKLMPQLFTLFLGLIVTVDIYGQELDLEKKHTISGKAKRGMLKKIAVDESNNNVGLIYVTKSTNKKAKFETYNFDLDFNFKDKKDEELEFDKAKTKYKWFKYKGESYEVEGLNVAPNLMGKLVLKKKRVSYTYNWFWGGYDVKKTLLAKVKPKDEQGRKFYYYRHAEYDNTGNVLVITGVMDKINRDADPNRFQKEFHFLKFDKDAKLLSDNTLKFDNPQMIVSSTTLAPKTGNDQFSVEEGHDYILIFAPMGGGGMKKTQDAAVNYTYVRLSTNGEVKEKIPFKSHNSYWQAENIMKSGDDIVVFGPANDNTEKHYNLGAPKKLVNFQLMKVNGGSIAFHTNTNLEEFESKMKTPKGQKKTPAYKGKKFALNTAQVLSNGEVIITGQNFKTSNAGNQYSDILMFHFNVEGRLKAQYGVKKLETNKYALSQPVMQYITESQDKKSFYWTVMEIKGIRTNKELGASKVKTLVYPNVTKVNIVDGSIGSFNSFGGGKYFLNNNSPVLPIITKGMKLVFFGEDKKGSELWFGRMPIN